MKTYDRVYATVDLDAIAHNMRAMRRNLSEEAGMMGVVKADGYGHGSVPVAWAIDPYVEGFGVATVDEAIILRRHGIGKPVLVLGTVRECRFQDVLDHGIRPTVYAYGQARRLSDLAVSQGKEAAVHIAVDTGMSRIGLTPDEEGADLAAAIAGLPGIRLEGVFTHFAKADEEDKASARGQLERYLQLVGLLEERGVKATIRHVSNSAGIIDLKEANLDMVRAGISIYGLYPSGEVDREAVPLIPAMELKSYVAYVKTIGPGTPVSYGGTYVADREVRVATIPVGYGDGYPRGLSGKGHVLIRGQKAPILGRVCMDQFMVDVSAIGDVGEGDEVTLLGRDGTEAISAETLAGMYGGFHYELVCDIGKRVPRVYLRGGDAVGSKDYFDDRYEGFAESYSIV